MIKYCSECGKPFKSYVYENKLTCSKECSSVRRSRTHKGCGVNNPRIGKFETNINAKEWILVDPNGKVYKIRNLKNWARQNCHLFEKETSEKSATQIASGFIQIKKAAEGKRKYMVRTYKGWTLQLKSEDKLPMAFRFFAERFNKVL